MSIFPFKIVIMNFKILINQKDIPKMWNKGSDHESKERHQGQSEHGRPVAKKQ